MPSILPLKYITISTYFPLHPQATAIDMEKLVQFLEKTNKLLRTFGSKVSHFRQLLCSLVSKTFHIIISNLNLFWFQLHYYVLLSLFGYVALRFSNPRTLRPKDLDLFFTSVSSATVSSNLTVEMEVFSNTQLVIIALLMLAGGEISTSMIGLQIMRLKLIYNNGSPNKVKLVGSNDSDSPQKENYLSQIELGIVSSSSPDFEQPNKALEGDLLKCNSIKFLGFVVFFYLLISIITCFIIIFLYMSLFPSASEVLNTKGIQIGTFCVFTAISTFVNGGFIPTNENMMVFVKSSGLLLLLIPHLLTGNTLYGPCLFFILWVLNRITKREEFGYLLKNNGQIGYGHLLTATRVFWVVVTSLGFIAAQFILFIALEWYSEAMEGLTPHQKIVGSLFQVVNSRYAGESVFDLSMISPAVLLVFIIMMYLPPYTTFFPVHYKVKGNKEVRSGTEQRKKNSDYSLFSHISYLVFFIIVICIIERDQMKEDPLNFNFLNVTLEVVSAYSNVGFTAGYKCELRLNTSSYCKDMCYGFVGKWSNKAKLVLIIVMFFGRLKNFSKSRRTAWKLSCN